MSYEKTNWQDLPNTSTPVNATRLNKMETGIADANGMIGVTTYSSNSTYAVGNYCVYNNKLYRCITAITTGEAFNSSKWTETTVMNEKESILNKTTSISSSSTNTQYPSAKAVYDKLVTKENLSNKTTSINSSSTDTQYPSAKAVNTELEKKQNNLEVSGQGTNITLNGTSKNKFTKFVVKGKTEQEVLTGKNSINVTDKTITATGYDQYILSNFELDNIKSYVLSLDYSKNNPTFSSEGALVLTKRDNSYVPLIITTDAEGKKTAVITNTSSLSIYVTSRLTGGTIYLKNIMLELGSTATSYEPYCGGVPSPNPNYPQTIHNVSGGLNVKIQNKNILPIYYNKYTTTGTYGYYKLTNIEEDLVISISNKDTSVSMTGIFFGFSGAGADNSSGTQWIMSNGTQISTTLSNSYTSSGATTKLKYFSFYPNNETTFNKIFSRYYIQIEKGTTFTPYTEHQERNLPFAFSSGQKLMEGGYLTSDGVHNVRKQKIINGTENISVFEYGTAHINTNMFKVQAIIDATVDMILKCSHFQVKINNVETLNTDTNWVINDIAGSVYFSIDKNLANTVEEFRTWLSTNNVLIEYTSTTPTTTAYTSTQQSLYNTIQQAYSYAEQTNISSASTDLLTDLEVSAVTYSQSDDYTENELQIGTWLGKPLYRKVIKFESLPNNSNINLYHYINNLEHFTKIYGLASNSAGLNLPLPFIMDNDYSSAIAISAGLNTVYIGTAKDWTDSQLNNNFIVLEYTKTTD